MHRLLIGCLLLVTPILDLLVASRVFVVASKFDRFLIGCLLLGTLKIGIRLVTVRLVLSLVLGTGGD